MFVHVLTRRKTHAAEARALGSAGSGGERGCKGMAGLYRPL